MTIQFLPITKKSLARAQIKIRQETAHRSSAHASNFWCIANTFSNLCSNG